jgi:hypothetical protein
MKIVLFFSSSLAFFFGKKADQIDGFCYQRCQRVMKIWTVIHLRLHLSEKLRIHPSEITIPGSAGIIDVGSCAGICKNGGDCHAERKTAIVFETRMQIHLNFFHLSEGEVKVKLIYFTSLHLTFLKFSFHLFSLLRES